MVGLAARIPAVRIPAACKTKVNKHNSKARRKILSTRLLLPVIGSLSIPSKPTILKGCIAK